MLKIGEFAALAHISIRMLRHYDEMGLLKPVHVDRESGYRYYTLEQLPRLNRILALKDLGLALEEIRLLLNEELSADEIRGMLKLKQAQLHQHILEEQARLRRVENRLRYIEREGEFPDVEVVLKPLPAMHVISLRGAVWAGTLFQQAQPSIRQHRLGPHISGILTLYHTSLEFQRTRTQPVNGPDLEIAYVVDDAVQGGITLPDAREMRVWDIPAYPLVASIISDKPDQTRHQDALALWQWIDQHGYRLIAPVREIYLRRPRNDDVYLTDMVFPVEAIDTSPPRSLESLAASP